jgi:hypothetical protein
MPGRVNLVVLLCLFGVTVLSLGMVASAQILEGSLYVLPATEGPLDPAVPVGDPASPVQDEFAQGLGGRQPTPWP